MNVDKDFIEMLYTKPEYYNLVKNTILRRKPDINYNDLDTCISDVYTVALETENLKSHPNINGWLYMTAKNIVNQFIFKAMLDEKRFLELDDKIEDNYDFTADIGFNEFIKKIKQNLTETEYKFFVLKYIKQCTKKEISKIMNITEASVNIQGTRLKKKLCTLLDNFE